MRKSISRMTGIHAHFMLQLLMYCWNLRKLCIMLDERTCSADYKKCTDDSESFLHFKFNDETLSDFCEDSKVDIQVDSEIEDSEPENADGYDGGADSEVFAEDNAAANSGGVDSSS